MAMIGVAHGNGPQVGLLSLQAAAYTAVAPYPLDVPVRQVMIEAWIVEAGVDFEKVKVRADLDRPVTGVAHFDFGDGPVFVEGDGRAGVEGTAQWHIGFIALADTAGVFGVAKGASGGSRLPSSCSIM